MRAAQLDSEVTEMFRNLINVIRNNIQQRLNEIGKERLDSQLKQITNDNRMRQQQIQQVAFIYKVDTFCLDWRTQQG